MFVEKSENGFYLSSDDVSFEFQSKKIPYECDGLYSLETVGEIPVPIVLKGDRILLPIDEGVALKAEEIYDGGDFDMDNIKPYFHSRPGTMCMIIFERQNKFLLMALKSGADAYYTATKENGIYKLGINSNIKDTVIYGVFDSLISACKCYRNSRGKVRTLNEKIDCNPQIEKLIGGGFFWVFSNSYDEVMYASADTDVSPLVGDDMLDVAEELYKNGVDKALFGIFFEGDSYLTEQLYNKYGYICTQYDNYSDVWNPNLLKKVPQNRAKNCDYTKRRMKDYPKGIRILKDKSMASAWGVKGYDGEFYRQNALCPLVAVDRIKEEIPQILAKYPYYKSRFIDVYGGNLADCYSDEHPLTREECVKVKNNAFKALEEIGLIAATEDGFDGIINHLVYTEGLHSPDCFRFDDCGRNQTHIHNAEQSRYLSRYMMNPECRVPLWQMVYHDCLITLPYWGDSLAATPDFTLKKIQFACLYGCAPLFSFTVGNFPNLKKSVIKAYKKVTEIHKKIATLPMTDFEIITEDYGLQRSVFGDKYEVIVNFADKNYLYNGETVLPNDILFRRVKK